MSRISHAGLIVICLLVTVFTSCRKPEALQYVGIEHFKLRSISIDQSVISADLKYYNPNNFKLKLKRAEMDVTVNNNFLGHSVLDTLMSIPRKDTFMLPVTLQVNIKSLISNSVEALFSNEFDVQLSGKARLGKGGLYFNFPFSYQGKQKLKIF